jgi:hypothetical protein
MNTHQPSATEWIKASASNAEGTCLQMRRDGDTIEIRNTKDSGNGPTLRCTPSEWAAWLDGAKNGEFDHLL